MIILFDFDGTLVDVKDKYYHVYCDFLKKHKAKPMGLDKFWDLKRSACDSDKILSSSGMDTGYSNEFLAHTIDKIENPENLKKDKLIKGALTVLFELKKNHQLYLVSARRNKENLISQLKENKIFECFEKIITPRRFFKTVNNFENTPKSEVLTEMGLNNAVNLIVGDSGMDMLTSKKINALSCAVNTGIRSTEILKSYQPDFMIDSISDFLPIVDIVTKTIRNEKEKK